jgi:hypothetical protein
MLSRFAPTNHTYIHLDKMRFTEISLFWVVKYSFIIKTHEEQNKRQSNNSAHRALKKHVEFRLIKAPEERTLSKPKHLLSISINM